MSRKRRKQPKPITGPRGQRSARIRCGCVLQVVFGQSEDGLGFEHTWKPCGKHALADELLAACRAVARRSTDGVEMAAAAVEMVEAWPLPGD